MREMMAKSQGPVGLDGVHDERELIGASQTRWQRIPSRRSPPFLISTQLSHQHPRSTSTFSTPPRHHARRPHAWGARTRPSQSRL